MSFLNYVGTQFENNILPAIPPGATISSTSKIDASQAGKIPGRHTANGATGFVDWSNYTSAATDLHTWSGWPEYNVSLNCRSDYVGIDIDSEDADFTAMCVQAVELFLGIRYAKRARSNSGRILLVFAGNVGKRALKFVNERTGESVGIDILGRGSQFIIEGLHPTGGHYYWVNGELYEFAIKDDLIVIDDLMIDQFLNEIITRASNTGWTVIQGKKSEVGSSDNVEYMPQSFTSEGDWIDADSLRMLSANMRQMIKNGVEVGSRSNAIASVNNHLINVGFSDNDIARVLLNPEHGIGDKCREWGIEATMKDISRCRGKFQTVEDKPESGEVESVVDELSEDHLRGLIDELERGCPTTDIEPILERMAKLENKLLQDALINELKTRTGVTKAVLRETLRAYSAGDGDDAGDGAPTHNQLAGRYLRDLTDNSRQTVHFADRVYELGNDMIWEPCSKSEIITAQTMMMDGEQCYTRNSDYKAVYECYCRRIDDEDFLVNRPTGIALADGYFYSMSGIRPVQASDHQTWKSKYAPDAECSHEHWDAYKERTFAGPDKDGQIKTMLQSIGLSLLGELTRRQYSVVAMGPGATGKSVLLEILNEMLPSEVVGSVPPHLWSQEYYLASYSGLYLNIVGEVPEEKAIEGESFKKVLDRLPITARHPAGQPFKFVPMAANWFNCNAWPYLKDKSDAMMRRMLILRFNNVIPENERDEDFIKKLIPEIPYIMYEALTSVTEHVFISDTTKEGRIEWAGVSNNVLEFLNDEHIFSKNSHMAIPLPTVYEYYKAYCKLSSYRPYGRNNFNTLLREAADVQRTFHKDFYPSGNLCLRGYEFAPDSVKHSGVMSVDLSPAFSMLKEVG